MAFVRPDAFWLAFTATLLFFGGFYALLVPLPRYLARVGLPDWQIGLILGVFGVASVLGRPLAGVMVDRVGTRLVMLLGAGSLIVGTLSVALTANPILLSLLRVAQAAGYVAFTTAGTALVIELTPEGERGRRMALFGAAANLAVTITPAATGLLLAVVPVEVGFLVAGALAFVAGLLASIIARPPRAVSDAAARYDVRAIGTTLWPSMVAAGLFGAGFAAFFLFVPILAERRDVPAGVAYAVYGLSIILTRLVGGRWLDRVGTARSSLLAAGLTVAGLGVSAVAASPVTIGLAAILVAAGGGLFHPALIVHHARLLPGAPGQASAAFYLGFDLGIGLGSWLLGIVLDVGGLTWMYAVGALIVLGTLPLIGRLAAQRPPSLATD